MQSGKNAKIFAFLVEDRGNRFYVPCWAQAGSNNPRAGCGPEATRMAPALGHEQGTAILSNPDPVLEQVFTLQKNRLTAHKSGFILNPSLILANRVPLGCRGARDPPDEGVRGSDLLYDVPASACGKILHSDLHNHPLHAV